MPVYQAIVLGIVQGITEFLPISSTAHIILIPQLFNWHWQNQSVLTFDVAVHMGTLLAVLVYFWKDWVTLIYHGFTRGLASKEGKMFWFIVVASVPGALAGFLFETQIEKLFYHSPAVIAVMLMVMGLILYGADRLGKKQKSEQEMTFGQSLLIGCSQALAIIPGVSRSGITMAAGLFTGLTRKEAARFSFLLATPIIAGAGIVGLRHRVAEISPFLAGVITSAVVGFLVIGLLLRWLRKSGFLPFVWYRFFLGAAIITLGILGRI